MLLGMVTTLAAEYLGRHNMNRVEAATAFCRDLMRGDPAAHKLGYSAENALLAAEEQFELSSEEKTGVQLRLSA